MSLWDSTADHFLGREGCLQCRSIRALTETDSKDATYGAHREALKETVADALRQGPAKALHRKDPPAFGRLVERSVMMSLRTTRLLALLSLLDLHECGRENDGTVMMRSFERAIQASETFEELFTGQKRATGGVDLKRDDAPPQAPVPCPHTSDEDGGSYCTGDAGHEGRHTMERDA